MVKSPSTQASRKSRIVQAAIKCFIKHGVAQTRMSEVALKAGVDQPLIHYYFPTPDTLYASVIQEIVEELKEEVVEALSKGAADPAQALTHYIRAHFAWAERNPGLFALWIYFYYLAGFNPTFTAINKLIREAGRDRIASLIYRGIEQGDFSLPKTTTVSTAALNIQGLITGNVIMAATEAPADWEPFTESTVQLSLSLCRSK